MNSQNQKPAKNVNTEPAESYPGHNSGLHKDDDQKSHGKPASQQRPDSKK